MPDVKFPLCVIPAAGLGTRMGDLCQGRPKCLLEVDGKPIIQHVVSFWSWYAEDFVVVAPAGQGDQVAAACPGVAVCESPADGVCSAILRGLRAVRAPEQFIVALGDCLFDGEIEWPRHDTSHGVLVHQAGRTNDFGRSYAASVRDGVLSGVIEKPRMGLGGYWFTWSGISALMYGVLEKYGITEAMQTLVMADKMAKSAWVGAAEFRGRYLNVTYPEDLQRWATMRREA